MKTVSFTKADLKEFKKHYNKAVKDKMYLFIFKGEEYLTEYAKYVIEYLNGKFK